LNTIHSFGILPSTQNPNTLFPFLLIQFIIYKTLVVAYVGL
jgi:hypothetical protein